MKKFLLLLVMGAVLVRIFTPAATARRGYRAFGGEYLLLIYPLVIGEAIRTAKELAWQVKGAQKGEEPQDAVTSCSSK